MTIKEKNEQRGHPILILAREMALKFQIGGNRFCEISLKKSLQDYDFEKKKNSFDMRYLLKDFYLNFYLRGEEAREAL